MPEQMFAQIETQWRRQHQGRRPPARHSLHPEELGPGLANTLMIDRGDNQPPTVRFAGRRLLPLFGRELAGSPFLALFDEDHRDAMRLTLACCASQTTPLPLRLTAKDATGRPQTLHLLLLPLNTAHPDSGSLLAVLAPANGTVTPVSALRFDTCES